MSAFDSKYSYWHFAKTVRTERRWIFTGKAKKFIDAVASASKTRASRLKAGSRLYRAQVGSNFAVRDQDTGMKEEVPLSETRMIPDRKSIKNGGRANPPGFPYLYLASTPETALAEMRPWVGESLTLAVFETQRPLSLVLCRAGTENESDLLFEKNPPKEKVARVTWNTISREFARPVNREDQESSYLPTQILAEVFKAEGFDGLAYRSGLEHGTNVALFDPTAAKLVHRFVYTLKKVQYHFEGVPYFMMYRKGKEDGPGTCVGEIHTESPPCQ